MINPTKTYVKSSPRHLRHLIFVDSQISENALRDIMETSMHMWGGRYNPIIPVVDNKIGEDWLRILPYFDPDYIHYSRSIPVSLLQNLGLFHPLEYVELSHQDHLNFRGVNIHCLLHEQVHNFFLTNHSCLLQYDGKWDMPLPAKAFYQLNLGFRPFYQDEKKWTTRLDAYSINETNTGDLIKFIYEQRPYFKSLLSQLHVTATCLSSNPGWHDERFEWIIYEKENYLNDLLYFWNRQLFLPPKNILYQVISTTEEIDELIKDPLIPYLLKHFSLDSHIKIVSRTLSIEKLQAIEQTWIATGSHVRFDCAVIQQFPVEVGRISYLTDTYFKTSTSLLLGKTDFFKFPEISFESGNGIDNGEYAIDIVLEKDTSDEHKEIRFPYETEPHFTLCQGPTRINAQHRLSYFVTRSLPGVELSVPSDFQLIRSVLIHRKRAKELIQLPAENISFSSSGQKLSAFIHLFENNWSFIKQILEEKFWLQIFRYDTAVDKNKSNIPAGRGVFSYQDLENEINLLFQKYREKITKKIADHLQQPIEESWLDKVISRDKKEAFDMHINDDLNYLIRQKALFIGMKVKCHRCGTNPWYSLTELRDRFPCKGCSNEVIPVVSSKIYYKLSDTIINNLLSDQTKNHKQYDGNYIVLKTLLHLKNDYQTGVNSFLWSPCLDISWREGDGIKSTDLDIIVIRNGKLIIGEAKADATEFKKKVIDNIVWAGNNLHPDSIIIACQSGNLSKAEEEIRSGLLNKNIPILTYKTSPPWYHFHGIFGFGDEQQGDTNG